MNNFTIIYKILKALEKAMDLEKFDLSTISPDILKISDNRWFAIMEMLIENGFVAGATVEHYYAGSKIVDRGISITLKGLEYLQNNSMMKKASDTLKGATEIVGNLIP